MTAHELLLLDPKSNYLYQYIGGRRGLSTVLFYEQGLCERECTVLEYS